MVAHTPRVWKSGTFDNPKNHPSAMALEVQQPKHKKGRPQGTSKKRRDPDEIKELMMPMFTDNLISQYTREKGKKHMKNKS